MAIRDEIVDGCAHVVHDGQEETKGCWPASLFSILRLRVSRQDAPRMGVKVVVHEGESIRFAIIRLKKLMDRLRVKTRPIRSKGPYCWMYVTKEHHQKPSLIKRMKRVRKQFYARWGAIRPR